MITEFLRAELGAIMPVSDAQVAALATHFELMVRWNERLNLTRVVDPRVAARKHYGESALVARVLPTGPLEVADFGSGAGFPGIPIAVLRPDVRVTLIESHQRKTVFLREATRGMSNVCVVGDRAEALTATFDWFVSRAVRWQDVLRSKIGRNAALLISAEEASKVAETEGFTWNSFPSLTPDDRLVIGTRST